PTDERRAALPLSVLPAEIERTEIKLLDKHVNYTNRIVLVDPIIQAFRKQRRLPAIHSLDEALHRDLPPKIASQFYHAGRFHTAWVGRCRRRGLFLLPACGKGPGGCRAGIDCKRNSRMGWGTGRICGR